MTRKLDYILIDDRIVSRRTRININYEEGYALFKVYEL